MTVVEQSSGGAADAQDNKHHVASAATDGPVVLPRRIVEFDEATLGRHWRLLGYGRKVAALQHPGEVSAHPLGHALMSDLPPSIQGHVRIVDLQPPSVDSEGRRHA